METFWEVTNGPNKRSDVIMIAVTSQITGVSIVYSTVCSGADQRKHQSSASSNGNIFRVTTWINFNPSMVMWIRPLWSVGWDYLSIPKLQQCNRIILHSDRDKRQRAKFPKYLFSHRIYFRNLKTRFQFPSFVNLKMVQNDERQGWDEVTKLSQIQNVRHFPDDIFERILVNEKLWISITVSPEFLTQCQVDNVPALVRIMVWRRQATSHYLNQWWCSLLTHTCICVTRPQWVFLHSQYHGCWCPGHARGLGICSYGDALFLLEYSRLGSRRCKLSIFYVCVQAL